MTAEEEGEGSARFVGLLAHDPAGEAAMVDEDEAVSGI
jgi:hypothetical protein